MKHEYSFSERQDWLANYLNRTGRELLRAKTAAFSTFEIILPIVAPDPEFVFLDTQGGRHRLPEGAREAAMAMYTWAITGRGICPDPTVPWPAWTANTDPQPWMWNAAEQIDTEIGLPRFDYAVDRTARIISKHFVTSRGSKP